MIFTEDITKRSRRWVLLIGSALLVGYALGNVIAKLI